MKLWPFAVAALVIVVALFVVIYFLGSHHGGERSGVLSKTAWQRMALPGELSRAHAFLEHNCAACHTPVKVVDAANCIACHASNESLLSKQNTAFHSNVTDCRGCHFEHGGAAQRPVLMDHQVLAAIGVKAHPLPPGVLLASLPVQHSRIAPEETALDCNACHANQDRHRMLFGADCASCHATSIAQGGWTIPEFRHPSPLSTDCAQCHQAPPSHYMMHFKMVSMKTAGVEKAEVNQCFLCHKINSWNDIKGVGWYKHH